MGIDYIHDEPLGLVVTVWSGRLGAEDWRIHTKGEMDDQLWVVAERWLVDLRDCKQDSTIDEVVIREMTALFVHAGPGLARKRVAVLDIEVNPEIAALERLMTDSGISVSATTDFVKACESLGISSADEQREVEDLVEGLRQAQRGDPGTP